MSYQTPISLVIAQLNFLQGAVKTNTDLIIDYAKNAQSSFNADIIVFPELSLTGYPCDDLLLRPELYDDVDKGLKRLCETFKDSTLIVGHPRAQKGKRFNSASVIENGKIIATYDKQILPNYGVFDEKRYFTPGESSCVISLKGISFALTICEDVWHPGPLEQVIDEGAGCVICLNSSPFWIDKPKEREAFIQSRIQKAGPIPFIYVNAVGGQDDLLFDGTSMVFDEKGEILTRAPLFKETLLGLTLTHNKKKCQITTDYPLTPILNREERIYGALVLGTRDYVKKNGFDKVLVGSSGGIDSALTLCIAVDALGAQNVMAVMMPSRYTADMSTEDAMTLADNLKIEHKIIPIENVIDAFDNVLNEIFHGTTLDVTEENIQSRTRAVILMALSNKFGHLVLTTGNKSEFAVGYATLYGDMAGGFAVLKDVYKTDVYHLAHYKNKHSNVIPERIITRPPSAELAADQFDHDTLPSYQIVDDVVQRYVENDESINDIIKAGIDADTVKYLTSRIDLNEYKRRQAPIGVRISKRAFGRDWRYPLSSGFSMPKSWRKKAIKDTLEKSKL